MSQGTIIREASHGSSRLDIQRFYLIIKADRIIQLLIFLIIVATLLISFSGQYIPPIKNTQTSTVQMFSFGSGYVGSTAPVKELNLYALSPDNPIYISIDDSQQQVLNYQVYLINDTNNAIGFGPSTLLSQGQISNTTTMVIPHTIYHMTYRLVLSANPASQSYSNTVTYTQTIYQYPSSNFYLLIPGMIFALGSIVLLGAKIILVYSDKEKYLSSLTFKNQKDADKVMTVSYPSGRANSNIPWYFNIIVGILLCALGFTIFGTQFILTWISVILIIAGISFILNGVARRLSSRRY